MCMQCILVAVTPILLSTTPLRYTLHPLTPSQLHDLFFFFFLIAHKIQFLFLVYSWVPGSSSGAWLTYQRSHSLLKKTDFPSPRSCQLSVAPQLEFTSSSSLHVVMWTGLTVSWPRAGNHRAAVSSRTQSSCPAPKTLLHSGPSHPLALTFFLTPLL